MFYQEEQALEDAFAKGEYEKVVDSILIHDYADDIRELRL